MAVTVAGHGGEVRLTKPFEHRALPAPLERVLAAGGKDAVTAPDAGAWRDQRVTASPPMEALPAVAPAQPLARYLARSIRPRLSTAQGGEVAAPPGAVAVVGYSRCNGGRNW